MLLYVSNKIGLISISRTKRTNDAVRTIIAYELLKNCILCDEIKENFERSCQVMSLFRQEDGRNATVHCMTVGVKPKNFKWVVNDKVIFKSQTPEFKMTEARAGIYICKLTYDNGKVLQSKACKVECTRKDKIQFNLDSVKKILNEWFL